MACPAESTLPTFCISGSLTQPCSDGTCRELRVIAELVNPIGGIVLDPTANAIVLGGTVYDSAIAGPVDLTTGRPTSQFPDGNDCCWSTCALPANIAADPEMALQPGGTYYSISVLHDGGHVPGSPYIVQLDADKAYDLDENGCVPITELIDPLPSLPPTARFCDAVTACLPSITGTGLLAGKVTGDWTDGWIVNLECVDLDPCLAPLWTQINENTTNIATNTANIASNLALIEGHIAADEITSCEDVLACLGDINGTGLLDGKVTGDNAAGWAIDLTCADVLSCLPDIIGTGDISVIGNWIDGWTVDYTDVDTVVTLQSFTSVTNPDGSVTITTTMTDGTTGTVTLPATPDDIYIVSSVFSAAVDNGDGTSTVTNTITLSDGTVLTPTFVLTDHTVDTDTWISPTSLDIDPATGTITFTYVDQDGNTQTLTDTVDPFADTNTTNASFVWDGTTNTLTITDSDGNSLPVTIQQATVADNGDNTVTITDADGNAVDAIGQLNACDGSAIDVGTERFATIEAQNTAQRGSFVLWQPDATDACTPAAPSCPDQIGFTVDPSGQQWQWPSGGPWTLIKQHPDAVSGFVQTAVPQADFVSFGAPVLNDTSQDIADYTSPTIEFCNPDPCRSMVVQAQHEISRILYQINQLGVQWTVSARYMQDIGASGGTATTVVGSTIVQYEMPEDTIDQEPVGLGDPHSFAARPVVLAPGECLLVAFDVRLQNTVDGQSNTAATIRHRFDERWRVNFVGNAI